MAFARAVANGEIRVIDLTQTLSQEFPTIVLPPELGQCAPFRIEEVSRYDERGPAWYWNNISLGEHTGTHFDAPIHWISGNGRRATARSSREVGSCCARTGRSRPIRIMPDCATMALTPRGRSPLS